MQKLSNKFKLAAVTVALSTGLVASPAQAGVMGSAILNLTNFAFYKDSTFTTPITQGTDISITSGGNSGSLQADLQSVPGTSGSTQFLQSITGATGGQFDGLHLLEGAPGRLENNFAVVPTPVTVGNTYAYADNLLSGAAVAGVLAPLGVHAATLAEVEIAGNDIGSANSRTGTNTTFDFIATNSGTVYLKFDYDAQALAYVSADVVPFSNVQSQISFDINLIDTLTGSIVKTIKPTDLNHTVSLTDSAPGTDNWYKTGSFSDSFTLIAGKQYQLTIGQQVQVVGANTNAIPEPNVLALLGLGLLGLVATPNFARRRK